VTRLLAVPVRGPAAWVLWHVSRDALRVRIGQFERDPNVPRSVVAELRALAADLEEAARQYRELVDRSRGEVADSVEVPAASVPAGLEGPLGWDTGLVAAELNCSRRWDSTLCVMGRLAATRVGREWRIDPSSVEDFKLRGVSSAA
jgi:hypothetical protein